MDEGSNLVSERNDEISQSRVDDLLPPHGFLLDVPSEWISLGLKIHRH
jgi:hypothetical protein